MGTTIHRSEYYHRSKNVRKFNSREEAFEYLTIEVFFNEDFISHVSEVAKETHISYALAYHIITNHLTDVLYEIDNFISNPKRKLMVRMHGYFTLQVGRMLNYRNKKKEINKYLKNKQNE